MLSLSQRLPAFPWSLGTLGKRLPEAQHLFFRLEPWRPKPHCDPALIRARFQKKN